METTSQQKARSELQEVGVDFMEHILQSFMLLTKGWTTKKVDFSMYFLRKNVLIIFTSDIQSTWDSSQTKTSGLSYIEASMVSKMNFGEEYKG